MEVQRNGSTEGDLELALRAYETALVEAELDARHVHPDAAPSHLREVRMEVIRQAEALPSACWPRVKCGHCRGQREVTAVHAQYNTDLAPEFVTGQRLCPYCWGTGMSLRLQRSEPTAPLDLSRDQQRREHVDDT